MNRLVCFIAMLPLVTSPAFCAASTKSPARHKCTDMRTARRKLVAQHKGAVYSSPVCPKAKASPLVGQVVYEAAPKHATLLAPVVDAKPKVMPESESDASFEQAPPAVTKTETETNPVANVLKACFLRLVSRRNYTGTSERSWVSGVNRKQSLQIADSIAYYVGTKAPFESTFILLAPTERPQEDNPLTPALSNSLRRSGFALVESKNQAPNAQVLRYQVSKLDDGVWVQLHMNQQEANRFYSVDASNSLVADAPFCVREVN